MTGRDDLRGRADLDVGLDAGLDVERALGEATPAPDLTREIMGRLGYMRATPAVSRRRRRQRTIRRGLVLTGALALVATATLVMDRTPGARRPDGPSLPAAIGRDVQLQQQRFHRTIRLIREIPGIAPGMTPGTAPPVDANHPAAPEPVSPHPDGEADPWALGPVRWL